MLKIRLYQVDQEPIIYGTDYINNLTKIIDIDVNLYNRASRVERELLNSIWYYHMGQVQNYKYSVNYVGQIMVYLMTISEHLSICDVLVRELEEPIEELNTLSREHGPITFISPTQLEQMLNQVKSALQKTNANCYLSFPALYYYYDMKFVSSGYDKIAASKRGRRRSRYRI